MIKSANQDVISEFILHTLVVKADDANLIIQGIEHIDVTKCPRCLFIIIQVDLFLRQRAVNILVPMARTPAISRQK